MKIYSTILLIMLLGLTACKEGDKNMETKESTESIETNEDRFKISLAQWSFNNTIYDGKLDNLKFAQKAADMDIYAIEYVNQFFKDKAQNIEYLDSMNAAAEAAGVKQLLIMVDGEGGLGELDDDKRNQSVENHKKWVDAAKYLGCHSIRVNAYGVGSAEEVANAAVDGLTKVSQYGQSKGINVIVENHGGYSSNGEWLSNVISRVNMDNCGTLPDFGNFCIEQKDGQCTEEYDRYKGVKELMPYAKGVSAKTNNFTEDGMAENMDYQRLIDIVKASDYSGYIGIEYEGSNLDEEAGIIATKKLLEKYM